MFKNTGAPHREGETESIPTRTSRFFTKEREWFFSTREGALMGPFDTREIASKGLSDFLEFINLANIDTLMSLEQSMTHIDTDKDTAH